jgi:chemotaxis protein CheX
MINPEILAQLNTTAEQLASYLDGDVREIFSTMVGVELPSSTVVQTVTRFTDCVTAMVGFAGSYSGMIAIHAEQAVALQIASQMLGMDISECDDDVRDALGEIANMVGGSFKHHFVDDGHEVRLSTPSVMSGDDYVLSLGAVPNTLSVEFQEDPLHFLVCVYLERGD